MYSILKKRPHTGWVCHGDTRIGTVTAQTRNVRKSDGRSRFYTATPISALGFESGSIGTRYPTMMAAARALWLFDRDYGQSSSQTRHWQAITAYRKRYDVTPGKRGICEHVPA